MPEPKHPPFDSGSITIPRTLIRWLDVNSQGGPLTRTMTFVTLPVFNANVTWLGYSDIVTSFNCEAPNNFSIKSAVGNVGSPNFVLCISYRIGGVLTRYRIWDADGSAMNSDIPMYAGQTILKNFRFEVWSTSQGNASQASAIQFYTSVAGQLDYRYGTDSALVGNDGQVTSFSSGVPFPNASYTRVGNDYVFESRFAQFVHPGLYTITTELGGVLSVSGFHPDVNSPYIQAWGGNTASTFGNANWHILFAAILLQSNEGGRVSFGTYNVGSSTFTAQININVRNGSAADIIVNGSSVGANVGINIPGYQDGLIYITVSYNGSTTMTVTAYNSSATVIGTATHTTAASVITDVNNVPSIQLQSASNSAGLFQACGLIETYFNPITLAEYLINSSGFTLPFTFPIGAVSTTN